MLPHVLVLELLLCFASLPSVLDADVPSSCPRLDIPYPFGVVGSTPARDGFELSCDVSKGGTRVLALADGQFRVLEISLQGYVRILLGALVLGCGGSSASSPTFEGTPYTFNATANKLTVIGCASICQARDNVINGSCSGGGCCQASIPKGLKNVVLQCNSIMQLIGSLNESVGIPNCSRVFILEQDRFVFSTGDLDRCEDTFYPVVLDWAIGTETCEEARKNSTSFACMENSVCNDSSNGVGYRCSCTEGYSGNPYVTNGCQDIDECADPDINPCARTCFNTIGGVNCHCPLGTSGDGKKQGAGCKRIAPLEIGLGVGSGLLVLLLIGSLGTYWVLMRRRVRILKHKFFMQNGGLLLQQHICSRRATARIFSLEELEKATDNFSKSRILGQGGYGTVYEGILEDHRVVAIKKSKLVDENQIEQFINEVAILSQINHRNVVKLLGCCLESEVPMLVYEFISNGNLFDQIHNKGTSSPIPWKTRLRIATETAVALSYLHTATSTPIIHRDVKSANILLDEHYTAKVSDFGASRLVPYDQTHVTTLVQGTLGYLDPEYFQTGLLTEKSEVYSFGVVLVELLTREKILSFSRLEGKRNLASHFILLVEDNRLVEVVDHQVLNEVGTAHLVAVSQLAKRCLHLKGEERPTMKEVAVELDAFRRLAERTSSNKKEKERNSLGIASDLHDGYKE